MVEMMTLLSFSILQIPKLTLMDGRLMDQMTLDLQTRTIRLQQMCFYNLGNIICWLIQVMTNSVTPDDTYSTDITDAGGIALIRPDSSIADQVGLGNASAYKEGTPLSSLGSANIDQSYERILDGSGSCVDANNNAADFFLRNPSDPQNFSSPITTCGDPTQTPTATFTSTSTSTGVPSATATRTPLTGYLSIIINEVAWMGTAASTSDEWIELYNPSSVPVNLSGWELKAVDGTPDIMLTGVIGANGYYLLEQTDNTTVSDVTADQIYTGDLGNSNEILQLFDPSTALIDTANSNGGAWPAGSSSTYGSMERRGLIVDTDTAWITNVQSSTWKKHDARGNSSSYLIHGTPGYDNWAYTVTPT